MINIPKIYQKHRPASADAAMQRAMDRASENAARIAEAYERSGMERISRRQMDAAAAFADKIRARFASA